MKKMLTGVMTAALVFMIGATTTFASGWGCGRHFTDVNGAGLCDPSGNVCQYVDADKYGVCDNYAGRIGSMDGAGRGQGHRRGCHRR